MSSTGAPPLFSVLVTTRNRPGLLARALASIRTQTCRDLEVVVVNDGSRPEFAGGYEALATGPVRFHTLPQTPAGHGPSYARNHAARQAQGAYLAFLDDDDEWTDPNYLAGVAQQTARPGGFDLHFADQDAIHPDGTLETRPIWLGSLARVRPGADTATIGADELLGADGFCHLNTTVVRRELFLALDGFDDTIRYEEDRDFFLRAIDRAGTVLFSPGIVARHYIPDRAAANTASTTGTRDRRALDQLRLLDKAILNAAHPGIRAYARTHKAYTIKSLAERRAAAGDWEAARFYAAEAMLIRFTMKWSAYASWLMLRDAAARPRRHG